MINNQHLLSFVGITCAVCVHYSSQCQKTQMPSSPCHWTDQLIADSFCLSVIELIWSPLHQRLTHIALSWCLITLSPSELLNATHPINKTSPSFPQWDLAWFTELMFVPMCVYMYRIYVFDHLHMLCMPSRWMWPGSIGTAWQTLAIVTAGETVSASVRPSLHMHTNAVNRGSRYTGDHPLSVVSTNTHTYTHLLIAHWSTLCWSSMVTPILNSFSTQLHIISVLEKCFITSQLLFFQPMIVNTIIKVCMAVGKSFSESYLLIVISKPYIQRFPASLSPSSFPVILPHRARWWPIFLGECCFWWHHVWSESHQQLSVSSGERETRAVACPKPHVQLHDHSRPAEGQNITWASTFTHSHVTTLCIFGTLTLICYFSQVSLWCHWSLQRGQTISLSCQGAAICKWSAGVEGRSLVAGRPLSSTRGFFCQVTPHSSLSANLESF